MNKKYYNSNDIDFQVDNEYRAVWDQFVLKLDVVDLDPMSGSEVLHWVTKFPVSIYLHAIQWNINFT